MQSTTLICATARSLRSTGTRTEKGSNFNVSVRLREAEGECRGAITICRILVEAGSSQQRRDRPGVASAHRLLHERRVSPSPFVAFSSCEVEAGSSQQRRDRLGVASFRRQHERRRAITS